MNDFRPSVAFKPCIHAGFRGKGGEPEKGIEPLTCGLRNRCSTTELLWRCANCGRGISGAPRALASAFTRLSRDRRSSRGGGKVRCRSNRSLESLRLRHPAQGRLASCMDHPNPAASPSPLRGTATSGGEPAQASEEVIDSGGTVPRKAALPPRGFTPPPAAEAAP